MGLESKCVAVIDGKRFNGKLLLEGEELILRGSETPRKFKLSTLKKLVAEKNCLSATTKEGNVSFQLEGDATKWLKKIQNPPTRESKLGIKPGTKVFVSGAFEAEFEKAVKANRTVEPGEADLILLAVEKKSELKHGKTLSAKMKPGAAIWIIYPKGVDAITQMNVFEVMRGIGLKDTKVMSFSASLTGLKFVIPLSNR